MAEFDVETKLKELKRELGQSVLSALGVERVVTYREKPKAEV